MSRSRLVDRHGYFCSDCGSGPMESTESGNHVCPMRSGQSAVAQLGNHRKPRTSDALQVRDTIGKRGEGGGTPGAQQAGGWGASNRTINEISASYNPDGSWGRPTLEKPVGAFEYFRTSEAATKGSRRNRGGQQRGGHSPQPMQLGERWRALSDQERKPFWVQHYQDVDRYNSQRAAVGLDPVEKSPMRRHQAEKDVKDPIKQAYTAGESPAFKSRLQPSKHSSKDNDSCDQARERSQERGRGGWGNPRAQQPADWGAPQLQEATGGGWGNHIEEEVGAIQERSKARAPQGKRLSKSAAKQERRAIQQRSRARDWGAPQLPLVVGGGWGDPQAQGHWVAGRFESLESLGLGFPNPNRIKSDQATPTVDAAGQPREAKEKKPKKAPGAYALFMKDKATELQHLDFGDRSREVGNMWKALEASDKEPYEQQAAKLKREYEEREGIKYGEYSETPKKEKKAPKNRSVEPHGADMSAYAQKPLPGWARNRTTNIVSTSLTSQPAAPPPPAAATEQQQAGAQSLSFVSGQWLPSSAQESAAQLTVPLPNLSHPALQNSAGFSVGEFLQALGEPFRSYDQATRLELGSQMTQRCPYGSDPKQPQKRLKKPITQEDTGSTYHANCYFVTEIPQMCEVVGWFERIKHRAPGFRRCMSQEPGLQAAAQCSWPSCAGASFDTVGRLVEHLWVEHQGKAFTAEVVQQWSRELEIQSSTQQSMADNADKCRELVQAGDRVVEKWQAVRWDNRGSTAMKQLNGRNELLSLALQNTHSASEAADIEQSKKKLADAVQASLDASNEAGELKRQLIEAQSKAASLELDLQRVHRSAEMAAAANVADHALDDEVPDHSLHDKVPGEGTPRAIVARIRKACDFDSIEVPQESRAGLQHLRTALNGSLQRLSSELYSNDTRFLCELLQNADDASFSAGVVPQVVVKYCPNQVTFSSNESGFTERDVLAICSIGQSSKRSRSDSIGEKGIGFKSIFTVSDSPHILSNGFSLKFDVKKDGILGYILPTWVEPSSLPSAVQTIAADSGATILLPLKQDKLWLTHGTNLHIPAESLLFLRKVQSISVIDEMQGEKVTHRISKQHQLSVLESEEAGSTKQRGFDVYEHEVPLGQELASHPSKLMKTSKVVLAFPRGGMVHGSLNVFCFLPVCASGLGFFVHADFALVANREALQSSSAWNAHLRENIAIAFVAAVSALELDPLALLPEASRLDPFWSPLPALIHKHAGELCIYLSESGQLVRANQILLRGGSAFVQLILAEELLTCTGLHFAADESQLAILSEQPEFGCEQLLMILEHESFDAGSKSFEWINAAISMFEQLETGPQLERMRQTRIWRLQKTPYQTTGTMHTHAMLADGPIWQATAGQDMKNLQLRLLHNQVEVPQQLLDGLDIQECTVRAVCEHLVLRHLTWSKNHGAEGADPSWKYTKRCWYELCFLRDHIEEYCELTNTARHVKLVQLRFALQIPTQKDDYTAACKTFIPTVLGIRMGGSAPTCNNGEMLCSVDTDLMLQVDSDSLSWESFLIELGSKIVNNCVQTNHDRGKIVAAVSGFVRKLNTPNQALYVLPLARALSANTATRSLVANASSAQFEPLCRSFSTQFEEIVGDWLQCIPVASGNEEIMASFGMTVEKNVQSMLHCLKMMHEFAHFGKRKTDHSTAQYNAAYKALAAALEDSSLDPSGEPIQPMTIQKSLEYICIESETISMLIPQKQWAASIRWTGDDPVISQLAGIHLLSKCYDASLEKFFSAWLSVSSAPLDLDDAARAISKLNNQNQSAISWPHCFTGDLKSLIAVAYGVIERCLQQQRADTNWSCPSPTQLDRLHLLTSQSELRRHRYPVHRDAHPGLFTSGSDVSLVRLLTSKNWTTMDCVSNGSLAVVDEEFLSGFPVLHETLQLPCLANCLSCRLTSKGDWDATWLETAAKRYMQQTGFLMDDLRVQGVDELYERHELICDSVVLGHTSTPRRVPYSWRSKGVLTLEGPMYTAASHLARALRDHWHSQGLSPAMVNNHVQRSLDLLRQELQERRPQVEQKGNKAVSQVASEENKVCKRQKKSLGTAGVKPWANNGFEVFGDRFEPGPPSAVLNHGSGFPSDGSLKRHWEDQVPVLSSTQLLPLMSRQSVVDDVAKERLHVRQAGVERMHKHTENNKRHKTMHSRLMRPPQQIPQTRVMRPESKGQSYYLDIHRHTEKHNSKHGTHDIPIPPACHPSTRVWQGGPMPHIASVHGNAPQLVHHKHAIGQLELAVSPTHRATSASHTGEGIQSRREAAGIAAETFMYLYLKEHLSNNCQIDWVSSAGAQYLGNRSPRDDLGFDMELFDPNGELDSGIGPMHYLIEVKSCSSRSNQLQFHMSKNEMDVAARCTNGQVSARHPKLKQRYVCALVGDAMKGAKCLIMLTKPIEEMVASGELDLVPVEFRMTLPLPMSI